MKTGHLVAAIVAMLCSSGATLLMWVFSLAALANASPEAIHRVKLWVAGLSILSLVCIGSCIWLLYLKRPDRAAWIAIVPTVVMGMIFIIELLK